MTHIYLQYGWDKLQNQLTRLYGFKGLKAAQGSGRSGCALGGGEKQRTCF